MAIFETILISSACALGGVFIGAFDLYVVCDDIDIADDRIAWDLIWDLIQEGCGYPNRNKAWKGVPAQVPSAGQF